MAGPSQSNKRKINNKLIEAKMLEVLEKSDLSNYDSPDHEDYNWDSTSTRWG